MTPTLTGYAVPLSALPGEVVELKLSSGQPYQVAYLRLDRVLKASPDGRMGTLLGGPDGSGPRIAPGPTARAAEVQAVPEDGYRGFGWSTTVSLRVPSTWPSGMYAAELRTPDATHHVPFVVKPPATASRKGRLAVLANTNTWNAYSESGGRSKYWGKAGYRTSFERPLADQGPPGGGQPLRPEPASGDRPLSHLLGAELWVLNWLEERGFGLDLYADRDLHDGIPFFAEYPAFLVHTHPEYWSLAMVDRLRAYLDAGGCLLYLAGNGLFERVAFDGHHAVFLEGDPDNDGQSGSDRSVAYLRNQGVHRDGKATYPYAERGLLGVAFRFDVLRGAPLEVVDDAHPFIRDAGLRRGDRVGGRGFNGAASSWELDSSLPGTAPPGVRVEANRASLDDPTLVGLDPCPDDRGSPPPTLRLLARGAHGTGYGADMTVHETGRTRNGRAGFVLSAGAIPVGGCLPVDPALGRIVTCALEAAGVRPAPPVGGPAE